MDAKETRSLLVTIRDRWLASVGVDGLVPGPFLDAGDISDLANSTGWTGIHLAQAIRLAFEPFDDDSIDRLFVPTRAPRFRGRTPHRADLLAILAGRIPALAAKVLFHGLAGGMKVVLKPSSAETVFPALLVNSIMLLDRDAPVSVAPGRGPGLDAMIRSATACVAYGSDITVETILAARRGRPTFAGRHMESFEVVFADAMETIEAARTLAEKVAFDTAIYDQSGCLSPTVVFVQEGGGVGARSFAAMLVEALASSPLSMGPLEIDAIAAVRLFLQEATLGRIKDPVIVPQDGIPPAAVLCDQLRPSPGCRTLQVIPFDSPVPDLFRHMSELADRIQGMACAGSDGEVGWLLRKNPRFRANHICAPGELQNPPALWRENGIVLAHELLSIQ